MDVAPDGDRPRAVVHRSVDLESPRLPFGAGLERASLAALVWLEAADEARLRLRRREPRGDPLVDGSQTRRGWSGARQQRPPRAEQRAGRDFFDPHVPGGNPLDPSHLLCSDGPALGGGTAIAPEAPGLGFDLDWERFRLPD